MGADISKTKLLDLEKSKAVFSSVQNSSKI
jgi:hypothetical protein